jgi:hypothetical protein
MDFDANGMLPAGIHTYDMLTFREQFVTCFPASQTRPVIFDCLERFVSAIFALCDPDELWVDGSFATTKINPNDADLIIFVDYADFVKLKPVWGQLRLQYPHVDMYIACAANEKSKQILSPADYNAVVNNRNYWRGQFGFDRQDNPKGIIKLDCASLKNYISDKGVK